MLPPNTPPFRERGALRIAARVGARLGRVAAGSEGTAGFLGVLTVRGRLYGRWLPMTASLSHMEEEQARRVRGRPEGGRGEPSHDRKQEVQS